MNTERIITEQHDDHTTVVQFSAPADGSVQLQPKVEALLRLLDTYVGQAVSRQRLLDEIWGGDPGRDEALTAAVCSLRRQLGDDPLHPRYIETVRGYGYRLIAPVPANCDVRDDPGTEATAAPPGPGRKTLIGDLSRRRVFRVLGYYLVVGWLALQVGEVLFEPLGVPGWCLTLLALQIGLGFPIAAVLAWIFQVTPHGVVIDVPGTVAGSQSNAGTRKQLHLVALASLTCVVIAMGFRLAQLEMHHAAAGEGPQLSEQPYCGTADKPPLSPPLQ